MIFRRVRAETAAAAVLPAIGVDPHEPGERELGTPRYLTAARRRQLIAARDRLADGDG